MNNIKKIKLIEHLIQKKLRNATTFIGFLRDLDDDKKIAKEIFSYLLGQYKNGIKHIILDGIVYHFKAVEKTNVSYDYIQIEKLQTINFDYLN